MLTVPSDVVVCWSFKQTTVRKKLLEHQFLKYYAIERRVCPNVELRSNRLAVVNFFCGRRAGNLLDCHLKFLCILRYTYQLDGHSGLVTEISLHRDKICCHYANFMWKFGAEVEWV